MLKSKGFRYFFIVCMALMMNIPLAFVSNIVKERKYYASRTTDNISQQWGGSQTLNGPFIKIPVTAIVRETYKIEVKDPLTGELKTNEEGNLIYTTAEREKVESRPSVYVLPHTMDLAIDTISEMRRRGIFEVPVYRANATQDTTFTFDEVDQALRSNETAHWDDALISWGTTSNKALRGEGRLIIDGKSVQLKPRAQASGVFAQIGDPRGMKDVKLALGFHGAKTIYSTPPARENVINISGDWKHPSFGGAFLPDTHTIGDNGFDAIWKVPYFARSVAQTGRETPETALIEKASLGLSFIQPNDFYQKAYRIANYALMFLGLTFLTILLLEKTDRKPAHTIQYAMIGLVQAVFVLLMVSFAEHIGFSAAYVVASGATIALITLYTFVAMGLGRRSLVIGAALSVLYAVLFFILQSLDYALLAGSILCFAALGAVMLSTRNTEWGAMSEDFKRHLPKTPKLPKIKA